MDAHKLNCPWCGGLLRRPPLSALLGLAVCPACMNPVMMRRTDQQTWTTEKIPQLGDVREAAPPDSVMAGVFTQLRTALENLPVLPEIPRRCMALIHDPLASMSDLADLVGQDPSLSVRILRVANSARYGGLQEIKSIELACSRLGLRTLADLVIAAANRDLYRASSPSMRDLMQRLWRHAIATAHSAEQFGRCVQEPYKGSLFLAGLLHDIGKVVLLDMIVSKYKGRVGRLREMPELLIDVINQFHQIVGLLVALHWQMPPEICAAILCHNNPGATPDREWLPIVHITCVSDALAYTMGYGGCASDISLSSCPSLGALDLSITELKDTFVQAREEVEALIGTFALD
jgi:HD-like signal output (HDOD) protein